MKRWSYTAGKYGYRVTVYERKRGSNISIKYWDKAKRDTITRTLGHRNRDRAKTQARELAAALLAGTQAAAEEKLTWAVLFGRYESEVSAHKKQPQDAEDGRRIAMWSMFLGHNADPMQLDYPTLERFVRDRQHGRIVVAERKLRPDPSAATIGADIIFLNSVLNWGTTVKLASGNYLLTRNPVRGYQRPKNPNPKRPLVSYDRHKKVLGKADEIDPQRLFGPFLMLVESLGWRVSALCATKASDLDLKKTKTTPYGRIHKRGEMDKEGTDEWVPLSKEARAAIDVLRKRNPVIGDQYLFPAPKAKGKPWSRWHARDLLERAETAAELDPVDGGDFHPYRRKWATERKSLPLTDVMAAGGWRDRRSLETSYMRADEATMYEVMAEPNKLREAR